MARRIRSGIVAACILAALFAFLFVPLTTALVVIATREGGIRLCARLAEGEEFELSYVHSVNRRPVIDTLAMGRGHLTIVRSSFDAFGAGMPDRSGMDGTLTIDGKSRLIWTVNRQVPEVSLFVGRVAEHALIFKGQKVALTDLARPGSSVTLQSKKISLYDMWKGRCLR